METKQKTTLTQGSVARGMLLFALPIFISNLFQQLYNAADSLIVGNFLGGEALAAVGSSGSLIFLLTGFVNGVSLGAGVVVARYFGAKDWDRMRRTIHTTVATPYTASATYSQKFSSTCCTRGSPSRMSRAASLKRIWPTDSAITVSKMESNCRKLTGFPFPAPVPEGPGEWGAGAGWPRQSR